MYRLTGALGFDPWPNRFFLFQNTKSFDGLPGLWGEAFSKVQLDMLVCLPECLMNFPDTSR